MKAICVSVDGLKSEPFEALDPPSSIWLRPIFQPLNPMDWTKPPTDITTAHRAYQLEHGDCCGMILYREVVNPGKPTPKPLFQRVGIFDVSGKSEMLYRRI